MMVDKDVPQLTTGFCDKIASSTGPQDPIFKTSPILQIFQAKCIGIGDQKRWRVLISDGTKCLQAIVATRLNNLFERCLVKNGSIVRVGGLGENIINGRRIVCILGLEVLLKEAKKIGSPTACALEAPPGTTSKPPGATGSSGSRTVPSDLPDRTTLSIENLNPYSNNWTVKVLVAQKSEIRTWSNQRGEGKFFNVALLDDTGEIRGTCFNSTIIDELHGKLREGKVYYVSKAKVSPTKKEYNNTAHDFQLTLEKHTEVEECADLKSGVPVIKHDFVKLGNLINKPKDSTCDVIAVVSEVGQVSPCVTRDNRTFSKRELTLVDRSDSPIKLTLWGKQAEAYKADRSNPVVAFKGVKIGEFQGRTLSTTGSSVMTINPDIPDAYVLRGWYDSVGVNRNFATSSWVGGTITFNRAEVRTIEDVEANLQVADRAEIFSCRGTIVYLGDENLAYPACPDQPCKKKVTNTEEGWRCERCGKIWKKPEHRYTVSMLVSDYTGQARLQGFHDVGLAIFDMSADDLMEINTNDPTTYSAILDRSKYSTFNFACRAKLDVYQGRSMVRYGISKILPLNYREEAGYLRDVIKANWAS